MKIEMKETIIEKIKKALEGVDPRKVKCVRVTDEEWEEFVEETGYNLYGGPFGQSHVGAYVSYEANSKYAESFPAK